METMTALFITLDGLKCIQEIDVIHYNLRRMCVAPFIIKSPDEPMASIEEYLHSKTHSREYRLEERTPTLLVYKEIV